MIADPGRGEMTSLLAALAAADAIADMLRFYGLDARSRSALRACFRHDDDGVARRHRSEVLAEALAESDPDGTADTQALGQFLEVFAALPEEDFAADWLERVAAAWRHLRQAGCAADLPLRAARAMVALGSRQLLGNRSSLSALEVEIVTALSAAGMCVAEYLARDAKRGMLATAIDDIADEGHGQALGIRLTAALAHREAPTVGLLALRLRLGSGTLTLDLAQRDALLDAAIERLRGLLRECDVLVRTELHGCAIILPNLHTPAQVQLAANKVVQALEQPLPLRGSVARAVFALGVVWSPAHGNKAEELIRCVDLAVEAALRDEKSVVLFDDQLLVTARQEALIEKEFMSALENGQLAIHIQPQVDLASGRCVGGELLMRWTTSQGFKVPPWQIPDVAQRLGAAPQLTRWLVFGACRILAELTRAGVDIGLSVNLMARDLMDPELPLLVEQAIKFWRVPPSRLTFELIESAVLGDPTVGAGVMNRLIDLGVSTSIDDFGIGYSSILYLRQLPLHELKIDRVFVDAMSRSKEDREIVDALIRLSHGLDLHVVAEGIEDEQTMNLLRDMGSDRGQGYWISKAMPAADMPAWVADWNARASANPTFQASLFNS
ncbi:MAG TPA: GGDEF domain-containing phosphodiesterase [Rhodocyclaceae bacterium]|nr:GGDEF domain-containing phosphodiesterase [Rhodocyclaceae bacterium]